MYYETVHGCLQLRVADKENLEASPNARDLVRAAVFEQIVCRLEVMVQLSVSKTKQLRTSLEDDLHDDSQPLHRSKPTHLRRGHGTRQGLGILGGTAGPSISMRPSSRSDFRIAIICALAVEFDAVFLLVDQFWDEPVNPFGKAPVELPFRCTGRIGSSNVIVVLLSNIGNVAAAGLRSSFQLDLVLVTGICGGIPVLGTGDGVLLGDVVISKTIV
ncbi:hypothetical protein QBC36DRAFT_337674 [Triangularia setosa]|uniref:Nucleoside phosphorylase domain-containing protein n=1 Tax=Triangularia setosa TaxID=2587417 RepID=A0AAN6W0B6_9PEZI|nr:hypothetical protein QBC36DRAFT_337674 [Podospora setosa]